jgi:DNA topoisomerase-1
MKHLGCILIEFAKEAAKGPWWMGRTFHSPKSGLMVKFKSLPPEEQKRLNALHKEKKIKQEQTPRHQDRLNKKEERAKNRELRKKLRDKRNKEKDNKRKEFENMTPASHPNFFTDTGKKLFSHHGLYPDIPVLKNPEYDSKLDNGFYAKQQVSIDEKTGKPHFQHFYTIDYINKAEKQKFANNQRFHELLPEIRNRYTTDLSSDDSRRKAYSTAVALVDQAAMRIGNKESEEENDVRGLHNLQVKHMTVNGNTVELTYTGKKQQPQKHTFKVSDTIKKNLLEFTEGKGPEDSIFTFNKKGKQIRISPRRANTYLKEDLGSNVTIHHFRHHHGSLKAQKYLSDAIESTPKMTPDQAKQTAREATIVVSDYLGNTPNVARKHYIDPTIFEDFYKQMHVNPKEATDMSTIKKTAASEAPVSDISVTDSLNGTTVDEDAFYQWMGNVVLEELEPFKSLAEEDIE